MMNTFKAKLVDTTNCKVEKFINKVGECAISDNFRFLMQKDDSYFLTTEVEGIIANGNEIFIETKNSTYTLEIIEEEK